MAHFAKLNKETKVVESVVVATQAWVYSQPDAEDWVQTSYNGNFRKNYAGIGYTYDSQRDAFIPPKPYESWVLNEETCLWEPPVAKPTTPAEVGEYYVWNETSQKWDSISLEE
jgi:hypothetical protein